MKLFFLLIIFCSSVYSRPEIHMINSKEIVQNSYIKDLLIAKEEKIKISKIAFELSKEVDQSVNVKNDLKVIKALANAVRKESKNSSNPDNRIAALNKVIFFNSELRYDFSDPKAKNPENNLLSLTLRTYKGSCLTMPLLYISVAQELGWPIYPVIVQNHLFLRYVIPTGGEINIEATSGGGSYSDSWYIKRFEVSDLAIRESTYMKTAKYKELIGVLLQYNATNYAKQKNHLKAFEYIDAAIELFPTNPNLIMTKAKILSEISEEFTKKGQFFDSQIILGEANKYAAKARALGFKFIDNSKYLKEMREIASEIEARKKVKPLM